MDVKKEYLNVLKGKIEHAYDTQLDKIGKIANMFGEVMDNGGVVQLFGVRHGIEFVNELNYRAGGIAPFHKLSMTELMLLKKVTKDDVYKTGAVYQKPEIADELLGLYDLDDRDMYVLVSEKGCEPLVLEIARKAKEKGQKIVAVVNKKYYDHFGGKLLDYADEWLDMQSECPDLAVTVGEYKVGQTSTTVTNIMAQMLTAELYRYFIEKHGEAPILLSANVKGADVHNDALTDPYGRRVRP
ncbi:MAG: sugar isomerase domain-containing protein [Erysipelotrichaceae bacterium]|nr:sugar isomerase domain-containing protein [Erysipelotrichaceae bacterium]